MKTQRAICPKCGELAEAKDGKPSEYECAKCGVGLVEFKLEIATVDEMEIFRTGKWKGHNYTVADLDSMIANQEKGIIRGYMYTTPDGDHDPRPTGSRPLLESLSQGWIEKLWRVGDRLKAKIKQVPAQIADMIDKGAIKQKSVEVWPKFKTQDGKQHGAVFEALLMFGRGLPAVYDLDDAVKVYYTVKRSESDERQTIDMEKYSGGNRSTPRGGPTPDDVKIQATVREAAARKLAAEKRNKEIIMSEELEKLRQAETAKMQAELALEKMKGEHTLELTKLKAEIAAGVEKIKAETEKHTAAMRESRKADVVKFVDERIAKFQILPTSKASEVDQILGMPEADAKVRMTAMEKLAPVHTDAEVATTEPDYGKLPQALKDDVKKADKIESVAEELMKKNPAMSASEALERAKASVT